MNQAGLLGTQRFLVPIPALAAAGDATAITAQWIAPFKCRIISIRHFTHLAFTGQATNFRSVNAYLQDGATKIAGTDYSAAGQTTGPGTTGKDMALVNLNVKGQATPAANVIAQGSAVLIKNELTGTGQAMGAGMIQIEVVGTF